MLAPDSKGYGQIRLNNPRKMVRAHRLVWELFVAPIPNGLVLDHLCNNKICVNPDHLELKTNAENVSRSTRNKYCKQGHNMELPNGRTTKNACRVCANAQWRKAYSEGRLRRSKKA